MSDEFIDINCMMCLANLAAGAPSITEYAGNTKTYKGITHSVSGVVWTCELWWHEEWGRWVFIPKLNTGTPCET